MPGSKKRPVVPCQAPTGLPLTKLQLASYVAEDTAETGSRQGSPAAWIVRRVPVSLAAARVYAELHGIGGAP